MANDAGYPAWGSHVSREPELKEIARAFDDGIRVVEVIGPPGSGKTALLREYVRRSEARFPGGIIFATGEWHSLSGPAMAEVILARMRSDSDALLVIDEVIKLWPTAPDPGPLTLTANRLPRLRYLAADEVPDGSGALSIRRIELGGLSAEQSATFLTPFLDVETAKLVHNAFDGNPRLLLQAAQMLSAGRSLQEILELSRPFSSSAILGPDGHVATSESAGIGWVESSVRGVSEELISQLAQRPELLHTLHWRTFEELVAELFARRGFEVTLTPPSNDGGVDIYAARSDHLGSFLYVIDCKRWAPDRPVGPGLVRQLYGVVERERATHGILATTSFFSPGARAAQEDFAFRLSLRDYVDIHAWLKGSRRS